MTKRPSTSIMTATAADKILQNPAASPDEKSVAASAVEQLSKGRATTKAIAVKAGSILNDPDASREAKIVAASTLIQWPHKTPKNAAQIRAAVVRALQKLG